MTILLTGQCGYIGSHVAKVLLKLNKDFIGLDNLYRGIMENNYGPLVVGDIRNINDIEQAFSEVEDRGSSIDAVIHMAALTSVPESMEKRDEYEDVILEGTENLIKVMKNHSCNKLVFSSTASVYKQSDKPVKETDPLQPLNNYALMKYFAEQAIRKHDWLNSVIFRYFNVIGYDEDYDKSNETVKTNLVPALLKSIQTKTDFNVYGNSYPVKRKCKADHTCVRDYIDVRDIAEAHGKALDFLNTYQGHHIFNLGTKTGYSVLEMILAFKKANNVQVKCKIKEPRKGDPASVVADNQKAKELLGWSPMISLEDSLRLL